MKPIQHASLPEMAENKIREAILDAGLKPGDTLPSEMDLARELGVSRNVVREALSRLRMLGVLDTRQRRGMVLREPDVFGSLARLLDLPVLSDDTRRNLFELRLVVEIGLADLVFMNRTEEDLAALHEIVEVEEEHAEDPVISVKCDIAFHTRLYKIAGNPTLNRFQALLEPFFTWEGQKGFEPERFKQYSTVSHRDLARVLETGSPDRFREAMRRHLEPHFQWLKER
jgi:DNA-binding FadR family transcriptional regulator